MGKEQRVSELTDKQRDCLRLVSQNYSSKEIGRKLGVSPFAVDQRLRIAIRNLDVSNRFEAARMLTSVEQEAGLISQPLIYQAPHLEPQANFDNQKVSSAHRDQGLGSQPGKLQDAGVAVWPPRLAASLWENEMVSELRGLQTPISWQLKAGLAVIVALLSLIAFGAAVAGLEVLSRLN
jgi:DNA-binding CsgD family transcriptional regulator